VYRDQTTISRVLLVESVYEGHRLARIPIRGLIPSVIIWGSCLLIGTVDCKIIQVMIDKHWNVRHVGVNQCSGELFYADDRFIYCHDCRSSSVSVYSWSFVYIREIETNSISEIYNMYIENKPGDLHLIAIGDGDYWLDTYKFIPDAVVLEPLDR